MKRSSQVAMAAVAALLGGIGCSGSGPYPVSGQVVFDDGKPATELKDWSIVFENTDMRVSSMGTIDAEARFVLDYHKRGDGALPGAYKVVISDPNYHEPQTDTSKKKRPLLPSKYTVPESTPLTAIVEAKKNDITVTVSRQ